MNRITLSHRLPIAAVVVLSLTVFGPVGWTKAQDAAPPVDEEINPLVLKQKMIHDRFERFQDRVFRLREQLAETEPENAARLQQALERAGEMGLSDKLEEVIALLNSDSTLHTALDAQAEWVEQVDRLLSLLLERDGENDLREQERDRLGKYKEQVDRILAEEKALRDASAQAAQSGRMLAQLNAAIERLDAIQKRQSALSDEAARTTSGEQSDPTAETGAKQEGLSRETDQLGEDVERLSELKPENDADPTAADEARPAMAKAAQALKNAAGSMQQAGQQLQSGQAAIGQASQQDAQQALQEAREQLETAKDKLEEQSEAQHKAEEQKELADETEKLADQMRQDASKGQGGGQSPQGGQSTPGLQSLDQAQREMDGAGESLEQNAPEQAVPKQERAIEELEQAQRELEKALNQLRQEERAETLRDLEHRFREMLSKQRAINEGTLALDRIAVEAFTRIERLQLADLVDRERTLSREASTCLHILEEDATTIVFPRIIGQLAEDMSTVADRLTEQKVGAITQNIEREIVDTLEQLLEAVQRMQQENERMAGGGGPSSSNSENQPLLPTSAELKLLKASQVRINDRTDVIAGAVQSGAESGPSAAKAFRTVAARQKETEAVAREFRDSEHMPQ